MASAPPILVVIPTCDRPAMLAEALASVIAQDDRDWVAVVADDGERIAARDAVPPALAADPRIAWCRAATRTAGGARNAATVHGEERVLRGEASLVAFLDDDDVWRPGHLAASRRALAAAPDAAFVHGAAVTRSEDGAEAPYHARERGPFAGEVFRTLLAGDVVATSSVVVRGDAFARVGRFREDLAHGEDWDLWLRLAARGPVAFVDAPLVVHRDHGGNLSRHLVPKARDQVRVLAGWWTRRHLLPAADRATLRRALATRHRRHVRRLLAQGRASRTEIVAVARAAWREVAHVETLRARIEARFRRRGAERPG